jgi:hypothetical protein
MDPPQHDGRYCWACSVPEIIWAKLALLSCAVVYDVNGRIITIVQPTLVEIADRQRQNARTFGRTSRSGPLLVPPPKPVQSTWHVDPLEMTPDKWLDLCTEISDTLAAHQWISP